MINSSVLDTVLAFCIISTILFVLTSVILFVAYKLPFYHVMSFYQAYYFVGFVVRPWELYLSKSSGIWSTVGVTIYSDSVIWSAITVIAAHVSMIAGFLIVNRTGKPVSLIRPFSFAPQRPVAFILIVLIVMLLGAYSSALSVGSAMNLDDVREFEVITDNYGAQRLVGVSGYQLVFAELIPVTLIILFATTKIRAVAIALIAAFVVYRAFGGAGRAIFVLLLLAVGCVSLIESRRRYPSARLLAAGMLLLLLFNFVGSDRLALRRIAAGEMSFGEAWSNYLLDRGEAAPLTADKEEFDVLTAVLTVVPERSGFTYGTQFLRLIIWPIPRQWWPDKPVFTSIVNLADYGHFEYMTITLYGELYLIIGPIGMVIGLCGVSVFLNKLYNSVAINESPTMILVYLMVLLSCPLLFRDGPIAAIYYDIVTILGALTLSHFGKLRNIRASTNHNARRSAATVTFAKQSIG